MLRPECRQGEREQEKKKCGQKGQWVRSEQWGRVEAVGTPEVWFGFPVSAGV